ncbi:hypothetical protein RRG08_042332, partial [Elysia crispata]
VQKYLIKSGQIVLCNMGEHSDEPHFEMMSVHGSNFSGFTSRKADKNLTRIVRSGNGTD